MIYARTQQRVVSSYVRSHSATPLYSILNTTPFNNLIKNTCFQTSAA